jgi:hypothetical protein
MNPHSPLWVRIENVLKLLSDIANKERGSYMEADLILAAMAKEQDEYDAWVNREEQRYMVGVTIDPEESLLAAHPRKRNETATEWLARMKKEGRIPNE